MHCYTFQDWVIFPFCNIVDIYYIGIERDLLTYIYDVINLNVIDLYLYYIEERNQVVPSWNDVPN